ncbi:MAG TPA: hypothetical protein ENH82_02000 [bacterium]|nr:hypothetical protein [bacterium]
MNLENLKKLIVPVLLKNNVIKAGIFGSYATGGNFKDSDIDILVDLIEGKSLLDLVGLKIELEEITDKKVDILTYDSIYPKLRERILDEEIQIL